MDKFTESLNELFNGSEEPTESEEIFNNEEELDDVPFEEFADIPFDVFIDGIKGELVDELLPVAYKLGLNGVDAESLQYNDMYMTTLLSALEEHDFDEETKTSIIDTFFEESEESGFNESLELAFSEQFTEGFKFRKLVELYMYAKALSDAQDDVEFKDRMADMRAVIIEIENDGLEASLEENYEYCFGDIIEKDE